MAIWRREHGRDRASAHALAILDAINVDLSTSPNTYPQVASIRIGAGIHDHHDFEVEVMIDAGVTVAVRYQSVDEEGRDEDDLESGSGTVAYHAVYAVKCLLQSKGPEKLAKKIHNLRVQARKTIARWHAEGAHAQFMNIRIVWTEYTVRSDDLLIEMRLGCLDDRLRPTILDLEVTDPEQLETELEGLRPNIERRFKMRTALAHQGATGMIDQLTINAISQDDDLDVAIRTIGSGFSPYLSPDLTVYSTDGVVQCHGRDMSNSGLSWNRNRISLAGRSLPETALLQLSGRPITDLVEHPVLSADMIITQASNRSEYGAHFVHAEFEQPFRLFCGTSGYVWDCEGPLQ